ncbi:MAG TPA: orotate phosphoribosyltransferase [Patescibacteria group bacterium]
MNASGERAIAKLLLETDAISLNPEDPYRGVSGVYTPIYTDARTLLSHQPERKRVGAAMEALVRRHFPRIEVIAGVATSGIPWASWIAAAMNLPLIYVRGQSKRYGKQSQVEGVLPPGSSTVIIDDVINTGKSTLDAIKAVRKAGGQVAGVAAISTYSLAPASEAFRRESIALFTLTNRKAILDQAVQTGMMSEEGIAVVNEWAADPFKWKAKRGASHV